MPLISVIIPTIPGREELLRACLASFTEHTPSELLHRVIIPNSPSCGEGWTRGVEKARGDYLLLAADDVEAWPGWYEGACRPFTCPVLYWPNGTLQGAGGHHRTFTNGQTAANVAFPLIQREVWDAVQPIPPLNHFCDIWITEEAQRHGYSPIVDWRCRLTHKVIGGYDESDAYDAWVNARAS